jgi:hypothetical protein
MTLTRNAAMLTTSLLGSRAMDLTSLLTNTSDTKSSNGLNGSHGSNGNSSTLDFATLLNQFAPQAASKELNTGRNTALNDPESAYKMMTQINKSEIQYKAQFAELGTMSQYVEALEAESVELSEVAPGMSAADITARVQDFMQSYNEWIERFAPTTQPGGVLAGVQAAEISIYELEQSIENPFLGAMEGLRGLKDMGITIDPTTHRLSLDQGKLEASIAKAPEATVATLDQFSLNFTRSADLLNAKDNFLPRQLDNRSRAIDYISNNIESLRVEFGLGDPAKVTDEVTKALSAYEKMRALLG